MELNINVKGDSPIEIAMLLKGMVAKQVEAVVNNSCVTESLKAEPKLSALLFDHDKHVEYEIIQDNYFLLLTCYGDCLYVLCELGIPVWCGHSLGLGRDEAQRRQDKRDGVEMMPVEYSQQQPKLPEMSVGIVDLPPEPEPSMLQTKVAGPGFAEPRYEEDTQVVDPQQTRPTDVNGYYWQEGTRCQYDGCNTILRTAGRMRESGYCASHRNS